MALIMIKDRLRGARLAAGIVQTKQAADLMGVNDVTYRHAERGIRSASRHLVDKAAKLFGVSVRYLQGGAAASEREQLAERIAALLADVDVDQYESPSGYGAVVQRLRKIRSAAGHDNINSAAGAHGWNRTVYWQHETGGRGITLDRMIAYCLAMGARPEYGVLGQEPLAENTSISWTEYGNASAAEGSQGPTH